MPAAVFPLRSSLLPAPEARDPHPGTPALPGPGVRGPTGWIGTDSPGPGSETQRGAASVWLRHPQPEFVLKGMIKCQVPSVLQGQELNSTLFKENCSAHRATAEVKMGVRGVRGEERQLTVVQQL